MFGNNVGVDELRPVFGEAMKNGLNLWDSAVVYGMGDSESILSSFTKGCKRGDVLISTKFTPQVALAWAVAKGTTPIIGVTKVSQVQDAVQAMRVTLDDGEMKLLEKAAGETGVDTRGSWEMPMV